VILSLGVKYLHLQIRSNYVWRRSKRIWR
jgi:hypothetical protein